MNMAMLLKMLGISEKDVEEMKNKVIEFMERRRW